MPSATMRAAVLEAPQRMRCIEVPRPDPSPGQVRVRIEGCGVCASNIPPWEGRDWFTYPMPPGQLGHEAWGVIDAIGDGVETVRPGERVSFLADRSYAEYDVTDATKAVTLPSALAESPFPGEPLGCAMNIFRECRIAAGETVAIVGTGFLGALLTKLASDAGATVLALSRRTSALEQARWLGAAQTIRMDDHGRIIAEVKGLTGGVFCDCVIEATGKQWPLDLSAELCRERGRLVIAGYHQDGPRQVNMQLWNWRGLTVHNAHWRDVRDYVAGIAAAAEAVAAGRFDPTPLYTHRYRLDQLDDALRDTRDRPEGFVKGLVLMN